MFPQLPSANNPYMGAAGDAAAAALGAAKKKKKKQPGQPDMAQGMPGGPFNIGGPAAGGYLGQMYGGQQGNTIAPGQLGPTLASLTSFLPQGSQSY